MAYFASVIEKNSCKFVKKTNTEFPSEVKICREYAVSAEKDVRPETMSAIPTARLRERLTSTFRRLLIRRKARLRPIMSAQDA